VWVCFGCKTDSFVPDFQPFRLCCFPGLETSSKFDWNIFQPYCWEPIRSAPQTLWVCFRCKMESSGIAFQLRKMDFQLFLLWCFPDPQNSLKFDRNIFQSCWRETVRTHPKHCGYVWVQNGVIRGRFSTSPARGLFRWCPDLEKSLKFDQNIFQPYWRETIRTQPKHCGYVLGAKWSRPRPVLNFTCSRPVPVVSRPGKVIKIWPKHSSALLTKSDKNCIQNSVGVCFGCKTNATVSRFQLFLV